MQMIYIGHPSAGAGLAIVCNFLGTDFLLSRNDNGFNELGSSVAVIRLQALHGLLGMSFASIGCHGQVAGVASV